MTPSPAQAPTSSVPDDAPAPSHLVRSAELWRSVVADFVLDTHQLELLLRLCEASDLADLARQQVAAEGLTTTDRYGQVKAHPAVNIERDARIAVARLVRELRLEDAPDEARPPRLGRVS